MLSCANAVMKQQSLLTLMSIFTPHGQVTAEVKHGVVHTYLEGGFNEEGIEHYKQQVLALTSHLQSWKLINHAKDKAGITPDAMVLLNQTYKYFIQCHCTCIVDEICSPFSHALLKHVFHDITVPYLVTTETDQIETFVAQH